MRHLDEHLEQLEASVTAAGGTVHWARDAAEANAIVAGWSREDGAREVVKVKSLATDEIGLNDALGARASRRIETDLAELIVQLGRRPPVAHPRAGHPPQPRGDPRALPARRCPAPRTSPTSRRRWPRPRASTCASASSPWGSGSAAPTSRSPRRARSCVVESEGNGRMCTTLPRALITVMGIEKVLPRVAATST